MELLDAAVGPDGSPELLSPTNAQLEPCLEKVGIRRLGRRNELMVRCVYCLSRPFPYHKRISSHFRTQRHRDQLMARGEQSLPLTPKEKIAKSFYPLARKNGSAAITSPGTGDSHTQDESEDEEILSGAQPLPSNVEILVNKLIPSRGGEQEEVVCFAKPGMQIIEGAIVLFQGLRANSDAAYSNAKALVVRSPSLSDYAGGQFPTAMYTQVLDLTVDVHVVTPDLTRIISESTDNKPLQYTYEASKVKKEHDALLFSLLPPVLNTEDQHFDEAPPPPASAAPEAIFGIKALEAVNGDGRSLFHLAAMCGCNRELALLLRLPRSQHLLNAQDNYGVTPLCYAAFTYNVEAVRLLLEASADPTTRDAAGNCARDWVIQRGHFFAREVEAQMFSLFNIASIDAPHPSIPISSWMPHLPVPPSHTPSLRSSTSSVASTPRSVGSVASSVRSGAASVQLDPSELTDFFSSLGVHEAVELSDPKLYALSSYLVEPAAAQSSAIMIPPTPLVAAPVILPAAPPPSPPKAAATDPHLANLDQMLRQLANYSEPSTPASSPPTGRSALASLVSCGACNQPVTGRAITAIGKTFHPGHFVCCGCGSALGTSSFFEHEGQPFCSACYWQRFGRPCHQCSLPIREGRGVVWQQRTYHPEHFVCNGCGAGLAGKPVKNYLGDPFCPSCYVSRERIIAPGARMCGRCKKPIFGEYITLNGVDMHPEHFACDSCKAPLTHGNSHEMDGRLYCEEDYRKLLKKICFGCRKPVAGRSTTAMGRVWHPEHFVCAKCTRPFADSGFFEHQSKPYCQSCYASTFAPHCSSCDRPVIGAAFFALNRYWHKDHFMCAHCSVALAGSRFQEWEGRALCIRCFGHLPADVREAIRQASAKR